MYDGIYWWADVIWLPILYFTVHKKHRWWAAGFAISTMILVRLLAETMVYIGYPSGIMGLLTAHVHTRAIIVSTFFYILFILMAHFSPRTEGIVFLAACLTFFFAIFVTTSFVMVL